MAENMEIDGGVENAPDATSISDAAPINQKLEDAIPLGEDIKEVIKDEVKDAGILDETKVDLIKDAKPVGEEVKEEINKEVKDEELTKEFKVPEDTSTDKTKDEVAEEETSWLHVGKEIGIELKEDNFDEFKTKLQEKETAAYERGKAEVAQIEIGKFTPEAQKLIEFLNSDPILSVDDFVNPLKELDTVLALDDEGIIRKDLELKGWEPEAIDKRIDLLEKQEALDNTAYELRKMVENNKEIVKNRLVEGKKAELEERKSQYFAEVKKENEQIKTAIDKTDTFLDGKVNKEVKDFLYKKWETGEYRKLMQTNPDVAVKSMLHHYLGEQAAKELKKDAFQKGRDNIQEKLHNVDKIGNNGETSGRKVTAKPSEGYFDIIVDAVRAGEPISLY